MDKIDLNDISYNIILASMDKIIDTNLEIVSNIREIYETAPADKIRHLISKHFIPTNEEKKEHAEIPTPVALCDDMLDKMPPEFWMTHRKVFEPCCGKGNFVLSIFDRFFKGLADLIPDEIERCRAIVNECLYYADLTPLNVFITTELLKCHVQSYCGVAEFDASWTFHSYTGDTLKMNVSEVWGVEGFDAVIGNPPYNNELWSKFTNYSIINLKDKGYLLFIHPCNWRKPEHKVGKIMKLYDIKYLKIINIKDTYKLFNCNVRVDWYLLKKENNNILTEITDDMNKTYKINIKDMDFIPNNIINIVNKVLKSKNVKMNVIRSHTIISNNNLLKENRDDIYNYEVLTNLNSKGKKIKYTNKPHEIYNKSKILMSYSLNLYPFYDETLSPTEHIFYQLVNNKNDGEKIICYLNSNLFKAILQSSKWIGFQTDHKLFNYIPNIINDIDNINDVELYKYFDLTNEEINLIESIA